MFFRCENECEFVIFGGLQSVLLCDITVSSFVFISRTIVEGDDVVEKNGG